MNERNGKPFAISANVAPRAAKMSPPQKFFGWPIFICRMSRSRMGISVKRGPIMSGIRARAHGAVQQSRLFREPQQLGGREVRLLPFLHEGRHLVVSDVGELQALLGHLPLEF